MNSSRRHNRRAQPRDRFIERIGHLFESDGLTRIAGRIFGYLLLTPGAVSLEELASELHVSKGSVSQDTRSLERLGAIERVTHPGDRRVYYEVSDRLHERMLTLRVQRLRATREAVVEGLEGGVASDARVRERLEQLDGFFGELLSLVVEAEARWSARGGGVDRGEAEK